jgi:predicted peptidase
MWLFHAEDDAVVPCGSSSFFPMERVYMGSRPLYERLSGIMGDGIRYTEYPRGRMKKTYGINPHCTWVPVASDEEAKKWLFDQRKSS